MEISKSMTTQRAIRRLKRAGGAEAKAMRAEYAELRKIANKRIQRAQLKGELMNEIPFPTTRSIENDVDFAKSYTAVIKFLNSKMSTAAGRKQAARKRVKSLQKIGYENVTVDNERLFREFMEAWRVKYEIATPQGRRMIIDSDFALEIFDQISETFTAKTNKASMMRKFNDYLRENGYGNLIADGKKKPKK